MSDTSNVVGIPQFICVASVKPTVKLALASIISGYKRTCEKTTPKTARKHVETHPHELEIGDCEVSLSRRSGRRDSDIKVLVGTGVIISQ